MMQRAEVAVASVASDFSGFFILFLPKYKSVCFSFSGSVAQARGVHHEILRGFFRDMSETISFFEKKGDTPHDVKDTF